MFSHQWQSVLCKAIGSLNLVRIKYDDDFQFRTYAPHIVYKSSKNNLLVGGTQITNPAEPLEPNEPRNFDLDKIKIVEIANETFKPHSSFSHLDKRYKHGVICHV